MIYPGGKNSHGTYHKLINLIPPHDVYIECCLGSGAIMRLKRPAAVNIGIDCDTGVIDKFTYPTWWHSHSCSIVICADMISLLPALIATNKGRIFVYCDPPYLKTSRRSTRDIYNHEFTIEQHEHMLKMFLTIGNRADIAISGYDSILYNDFLTNWNKYQFTVMTHVGKAIETVWYNYDGPHRLHDYNYLGSDYTDRQRIKRKIARHIKKLLLLQELERSAIIDGINNNALVVYK